MDKVLANEQISPIVNIGCGEDLTIRELAELIAKIVGFQLAAAIRHVRTRWNATEADGHQPAERFGVEAGARLV